MTSQLTSKELDNYNRVFPKKHRPYFHIPLLFFLAAAFFCTPPMGWQEKSRLYDHSSRYARGGSYEKQNVRVLLYHGGPIKIVTNSAFEFINLNNKTIKGNGAFTPTESGKLVPSGGQFLLNNQLYYGNLMIHESGKQYSYVNVVPLSDYLVSVVGHEMNPNWPIDALKAQAVVARTYVIQKMQTTKDKIYDIGNTTKDQVYGGLLKDDAQVRKAILQTKAEVIKYKGDIANVYFHSSCGGTTASAAEVWHEDIPYLRSKTCNFKESPEYNWSISLSKKSLEKKLGIQGIRKVKIKSRTSSKRVKNLSITTKKGTSDMSAEDFRKRIGAEKIKSTLFGMKISGHKIIIKGHGYGHGVGLCQWCAKIMAEKKFMKYRTIIRYFFPGTSIRRI